MYLTFLKPLIDRLAALLGLLLLSPLFLILSILLSIGGHGGAFFVQKRLGYKGKLFRLIKFKTMNDCVDQHGNLLADEQRLTRIGRLIRKTSLDEIPQLFNIIKGDMSLVGPRPLFEEYFDLYSDEQKRRHEVKPGITGWAQVNGRNTISWNEKFRYDVWYVDHLTFALDVRILFMTLIKVIKAEGISGRGVDTAEKFNGTN